MPPQSAGMVTIRLKRGWVARLRMDAAIVCMRIGLTRVARWLLRGVWEIVK